MKRSSGFTVLEVLVALVVFGLAVVGAVSSLIGFERMTAWDDIRSRAVAAAAFRLERLKVEARTRFPDCIPPASGIASRPDGIREIWSAVRVGQRIELVASAAGPAERRSAADSLVGAVTCP
jgi:prepilin-type N-terminal cleavage/methylation domain-containing protein